MNFLAHIYLSFNDEEITIGNFIADSVKSKGYKKFPDKIKKGILLHRAIDSYTDVHPMHKQSSSRLYPVYRHYNRVIVDIFYDHFLAKNWTDYSDTPLKLYVDNFYTTLEQYYPLLPRGVQRMMPYMISDNWLLNYAEMQGIARVLEGMNRRTKNRSKMQYAISELEEFYESFEAEFTSFFEDLTLFSKQKFDSLCED